MGLNYSDAFFDSLRLEGDPEVDALIADLVQRGDIDVVNTTLRTLVRNDQAIPEELPDDIEDWLRANDNLPTWADTTRIGRATALFAEHGVRMAFIMSTSSLLHAYAARKGVKVLTHTYRMGQCPYRRMGETAQFVLMVLAPGAFAPQGQAIPAIQKIRLMHGAIRHLIIETDTWNAAELGVPICQEDLLGTLITFSGLVIRDLKRLGIDLTYEETQDYMYIWRVIGVMLGIRSDIIPTSLEEAERVADVIARRHHGPSPEGQRLTAALLEMYDDLIPGTMFDGLMPAMMRYLVGPEIAEWLDIPHSTWELATGSLATLSRLLNILDRNSPVLGTLADRLGAALLSRQAIALAGYERAEFTIPTSLRTRWDLEQHLNPERTDDAQ